MMFLVLNYWCIVSVAIACTIRYDAVVPSRGLSSQMQLTLEFVFLAHKSSGDHIAILFRLWQDFHCRCDTSGADVSMTLMQFFWLHVTWSGKHCQRKLDHQSVCALDLPSEVVFLFLCSISVFEIIEFYQFPNFGLRQTCTSLPKLRSSGSTTAVPKCRCTDSAQCCGVSGLTVGAVTDQCTVEQSNKFVVSVIVRITAVVALLIKWPCRSRSRNFHGASRHPASPLYDWVSSRGRTKLSHQV